jgi:hypothetical protein
MTIFTVIPKNKFVIIFLIVIILELFLLINKEAELGNRISFERM